MSGSSSNAVFGEPWREPTMKEKPAKDADLKTAWPFLRKGVEHIMVRLQMGMSYSYYILLYTSIYDFCTAPTKPTIGGAGMNRGGASLQGADLYRSLHQYLAQHCKEMKEESDKLTDLALLQYYAKEWDRYTLGANYVNKLFNYLNKHWVKREKDEGRKEVYTVYTLALVAWKANFFKSFQSNDAHGNRLTQAVLRQIELQRNGESIDTTLLKKVIDSYVALGLDEADAQRQNLEVYDSAFQSAFLEATRHYYQTESTAFVSNNSVSDYLKKADTRLQEESDRVNMYLHDSTRTKLKAECEAVLISGHSEIMWDEFQLLLDAEKVDDLARMYGLLMRIPNGLEPLRRKFEDHVKKAGLAAVEKVLPAPAAASEAGKAEVLDPKAYVDALLEVHQKYSDVVNGPFRAELGFNASLDKACRDFCNSNAACPTSTKSPELLASYTDGLLRKSNKDVTPDSLEAALNLAMVIFKFIDDKDVFQKFYQKKLAQRLIGNLSASDDSESSMISKLKDLCGFDYTNKLTKMFQDVNLSRDLTDNFKEQARKNNDVLDVDCDIKILGQNSWPVVPAATDFSVPRELQPTLDLFLKHYEQQHSGRKLTWLWHVSKNELKTTYLSQKYILMTSSYQMAILVQFNDNETLSYKDIQTATQLSDSILRPQMALLVKAKVLLFDDEVYDLNLNFKSKKIRVQLNQTVRSEQKAETTEVLQSVDEDRKFIYQATIVRLMKARKSMKHQALIQEVTGTISTKFTPKVSEIKKAIDHLIDKEYLERSTEAKDT
ncbi:cullin 1, partial [Tremellales sp. Uapishka_1]